MSCSQNDTSWDRLVQIPAGEIASLPSSELYRLQRETDEALRKAKLAAAWLDGALSIRYRDRAAAARGAEGKDFGVARFDDGDVTVVVELPKKVEWKQDLLADIVDRIAADDEDPREYVDVILKVSERRFAAWPRHIRQVFEPARTVQAGAQSFRLTTAPRGEA
jgi:hypothetical protein